MASVLLVAPGVDRDDVGEAWVGYQWASRLSMRHEVTLLTHRKRGHESATVQLPGVEVVEWDEPRLLSRPERFSSLFKPWYPRFHLECRSWIRRALAQGRHFDIGHQPTPVAMRYPSPLAGSGIPFVLGPVGGSLSSPPGFRSDEASPWYVRLRSLDGWRLRHDPLLRGTYESASVVAGIAPYVEEHLHGVRLRRFVVMSETGIPELRPAPTRPPTRPGTVRLLFVGRVIRTKGVRDAIRAMALVRDLPVSLDVVGDGFDREPCEGLASELGIEDRVTFHGMQKREAVDRFYTAADVFLFPSYREPGGNAPYEAMSFALPLIVADRGGPATSVSLDSAILVTPVDPEQYAVDLAAAVRRLVDDPALRHRMGEAARAHVEQTGTWDSRIEQMERVYEEVMAAHGGVAP